jgi:glycosyltransferase involved in cell wall biosynthesis
MNHNILKVLIIDEGMNTGISNANKIGGGQIISRRLFSNRKLFQIRLLTSEKQIVQFWEGLTCIKFEPDFQTYRPTRISLASLKVKWFSLLKDSLRAAKTLDRHLAEAHDDIIFLNDNKSRSIYILSFLLNGTKKNQSKTAIQVDGEWNLSVFDFLLKLFYIVTFDKIICQTSFIRRSLGPLGKMYKKKLLTAYPGVEPPNESEILTNRKMKKDIDLIFGCIGTLRIAIKGQDVIIRAVGRLIKKVGHLPFKVYFFGDGPDRDLMEKMIQKINCSNYFQFQGYESDQTKIYTQIDACILASRTEVAPQVLMECLVRNIPVITASLPGCKEILSVFYDDLFFEQGSDEALTSILTRVLKSNILDRVRERLRNADKRIIDRDYQAKRVYDFLRT